MEAKTKKWLLIGGIILVGGIVGAVLYKKKKEKDRIKNEEEEAKAEVPIPYEVVKKIFGDKVKEVADSLIYVLPPDMTIFRFYKNNRLAMFDKGGKIISKGSYADGGKTTPSLVITLDNGKTIRF
jgi:hypothetical protein